MKTILIDIKNNLHGNNSRVDEAKNQINELEQKEAKNNQLEHQEEKIPKKQVQCKQPLVQFQEVQQSCHRSTRRKKERARNWKSI